MVSEDSVRVDNLPAEMTSFVYRREILSTARDLLGASRLITLVGTGGVGKTRLATHLGRQVRRAFADGVWFVDLSALADADLLADYVATSVQVVVAQDRRAVDSLAEYFRDSQSLLILDNCEHLLDACAELISALLRQCRLLRVVTTSREPIGIFGESLVPVGAMQVPVPAQFADAAASEFESITLFLNRAVETVPQFTLDADNLAAVSEICYRLDGVPLAIELAAVRLRALSVHQILERLSDPYRLLTGGSRTAPERQRTLRASIEWSYDLCTPDEQRLWARMSVFAGGCELDAAEGICADADLPAEDIVDLLQSLVEKSVVLRVEDGLDTWFRMLATIREFGAQRLMDDGGAEVRRRHRDWYSDLLVDAEADWVSARQRYWLLRMYRELPNIRMALEFCIAEDPNPESALALLVQTWRICWWTAARLDELSRWLDRALNRSHQPSPLRARGVVIKSYIEVEQHNSPLANPQFEPARIQLEQVGDVEGTALAMAVLGLDADVRGRRDQAIDAFARGVKALHGAPETGEFLSLLAMLAAACAEAGDLVHAQLWADEVIEVSTRHGERFERSYALRVLGASAWANGELERATALLLTSLRLKRELDERVGTALAVQTLAWVSAANHDYRRAALLLAAAEVLWKSSGAIKSTFPANLRNTELCEATTRAELGETRFSEITRRGLRLSVAQAIATALDETLEPTGVPEADANPLTPRESQIAALVAQGLTNRQIAAKLVIALRTAEGHVERVLNKLGFSSRTQIVSWVEQHPEFAGSLVP